MALSYNLAYQEIISVHPRRRQTFAGKTDSTFWNIWQWVIYIIKRITATICREALIVIMICKELLVNIYQNDLVVIITQMKVINKRSHVFVVFNFSSLFDMPRFQPYYFVLWVRAYERLWFASSLASVVWPKCWVDTLIMPSWFKSIFISGLLTTIKDILKLTKISFKSLFAIAAVSRSD